MKIKMLRSKMGSNDGVTVKNYLEGEMYEVSEELGNSFIADNVAQVATDEGAPTAQPDFVEGEVYHDADGNLFVGAAVPGSDKIGLLPIEQVPDEERAELITTGKLKEDGSAVDSKAIEAAPKNKAVKPPKNKAAK
jgi:hypothetical protein